MQSKMLETKACSIFHSLYNQMFNYYAVILKLLLTYKIYIKILKDASNNISNVYHFIHKHYIDYNDYSLIPVTINNHPSNNNQYKVCYFDV